MVSLCLSVLIIIIIIITTTYYGANQPVLSSASQTMHHKHNVGCTNTVVNLVWKISKFWVDDKKQHASWCSG